jgi:hypothetical protein
MVVDFDIVDDGLSMAMLNPIHLRSYSFAILEIFQDNLWVAVGDMYG